MIDRTANSQHAPGTSKCTRQSWNIKVHLGSVLLEVKTEQCDVAGTEIRQRFWSLTCVKTPGRTFESTAPPPGFLIPQAWRRAWRFVFLTSFQEILVQLFRVMCGAALVWNITYVSTQSWCGSERDEAARDLRSRWDSTWTDLWTRREMRLCIGEGGKCCEWEEKLARVLRDGH